MGMYTEFFYRAEIRDDGPIEILKYLTSREGGYFYDDVPGHPFFETCERWNSVASCSSYYFNTAGSVLRRDAANFWALNIHSSLKNYDGEIEKFCDWIDPHVNAMEGTFLGYSLYEESEDPVLIRKK